MRFTVTDQVAWSVGRSVCHTSEPCKLDEPMEIPFGLWAQMGSKNKLDGVPDLAMGRGNFGERGAHCKVQGHFAVTCVKTAEPIVMLFVLWAQ